MSNPSPALTSHSSLTSPTTADRKTDLPLLTRTRLLQRIKRALQKVNLFVAAPAGYGKSTLLRSLIAIQPNSYYFALSPADADLDVLRNRLLPILPQAAIVVLDDVHHLVDASETLTWLVERLQSATPRWVISGRSIPAPLITDPSPSEQLGMADLAFGASESKAILRGFDERLVGEWRQRTEGWPLALALLARQTPGKITPSATLSTRDELFAYLAESVFGALPRELAEFMQISALPLRFNDELLATVFDRPMVEVAGLRQEVQRRNLFIEPLETQGWFKIHDFVRHYLCEQVNPVWRTEVAERIITWFKDHDDLPMAIEHALAGRLFSATANLLTTLPADFVHSTGKYQTLRRWVNTLDPATRSANPLILRDLAIALSEHSNRSESLALLDEALGYAETQRTPETSIQIRLAIATTHITAGSVQGALIALQNVRNEAELPAALRRKYLKTLGGVYYFLSQFHQARRAFEAALTLPDDGDQSATARLRQNLIVAALHPLGDFERAEVEWQLMAPVFADQLIGRVWTLITVCWLYESMGDWARLANALETIFALEEQSEELDEEDSGPRLLHLFQLIGQGKFALATEIIDKLDRASSQNPDLLMNVEICRVWLARRTGHFQAALDTADKALAQTWDLPWNRGVIAVERELARFQADAPALEFGDEIKRLIELRARPWLMRLRALLALRCHQAGDQRWRVHLNSVLRTSRRYGYANILVTREPDLGAHFWSLCIEEGVAFEQASAALCTIGRSDLLCALLQHSSPTVRLRAMQTIATIGDETTIPALAEAFNREKDARVRAEFEQTLDHIEALPPPTLVVKLLGEFSATRADRAITSDDWQRPAARRLFQYLVLNQGKPISRDRILEELWPDSAADAARSSFKTVYSWLRKAIEPWLRPKSASRYIQVEQETYTFNPQRNTAIVHSDVAEFESVVKAVLKDADNHDVRPMPADFVAALDGWQPLLPELSYEAWTFDGRERLLKLYVEGCLYAASAMLDIDKAIDAALWAERAITVAPWSEEGWQELIRAQARQGKRALALKSYEAAVATLKRELDAPPSSMLVWLAKRLRADEEI